MEITLVGWGFDESVGFGVARYSGNLLKGLKDRGIKTRTISCSRYPQTPLDASLGFFSYFTLKVLTQIPKTRLYHFTLDRAGFAVPFVKRIYGTKVITTIHDVNFHMPTDNRFPLRNKEIGIMIKNSDLILAVSSQTKRDLVEHFHVPEDKIRIVPHGIDNKFKPQKRAKNKVFTIGYIGGFTRYKNVKFLLNSYSIFEREFGIASKLVLCGKGPGYEECVDLSKKLGIKNVDFRGFVDEKDLVDLYNSFDVFVFPSDMEGFGIPILEAQKCGLPVIIRRNARISEEIARFCIKADDEKHMAEQLASIHGTGFLFSEEHMRYLDGFTWDSCINKTIKAYEEVLTYDG